MNALIEKLDEDTLVANINHPTLNTIEFFRLIAKTYDASAKINDKCVNEVIDSGCLGFLPKPFTMDKLKSMLSKVIP